MKVLNKIKTLKVKRSIKAVLIALLLFASIGFVEKKHHGRLCENITIRIENQFENYFINNTDVIRIITEGGNKQIIGTSLNDLDLKQIEEAVVSDKFVKNAEVFRDLKGNLVVEIVQNKPIARLLRSNGPDAYISEAGEILPMSERYTARTVVLTGKIDQWIEDGLTEKNGGIEIHKLLKYLDQNEFWRAQIAEIKVKNPREYVLYPQVGKQEIIFGNATDIPDKFKRLEIFFSKILPHKGWNHYELVNVKFKDQIVCE